MDTSRWQQIMAVDGAKQAAEAISSEIQTLFEYQQASQSKFLRSSYPI